MLILPDEHKLKSLGIVKIIKDINTDHHYILSSPTPEGILDFFLPDGRGTLYDKIDNGLGIDSRTAAVTHTSVLTFNPIDMDNPRIVHKGTASLQAVVPFITTDYYFISSPDYVTTVYLDQDYSDAFERMAERTRSISLQNYLEATGKLLVSSGVLTSSYRSALRDRSSSLLTVSAGLSFSASAALYALAEAILQAIDNENTVTRDILLPNKETAKIAFLYANLLHDPCQIYGMLDRIPQEYSRMLKAPYVSTNGNFQLSSDQYKTILLAEYKERYLQKVSTLCQ